MTNQNINQKNNKKQFVQNNKNAVVQIIRNVSPKNYSPVKKDLLKS